MIHPTRHLLRACQAALLAGTFCIHAGAQTVSDDPTLSQEFRQIAPQTAPSTPDSTPAALEEPQQPRNSGRPEMNRVLAESWNGILLLPAQSAVHKDGVRELVGTGDLREGVSLAAGVTPPDRDALYALAQPYIGQSVTRAKINTLIRDIILFYRDNDRPLVDVYLPPQAMPSGIVQLVVSEARIGSVRVEGNEYFSSDQLLDKIRTHPGDTVLRSTMREDIAWINRNPFIRSEMVYEEGVEPGTTAAILKVQDRFPLRAYAGYNNSGNMLTSYDTLLFGLNWGNAFNLGDQMNYQYTTRLQSSYLKAHSLTYIKQLPWRHTLTLIGSYSDSVINGSRIGTPALTGESLSWSLGARYQMPLEYTSWNDTLTFGADFKRSDGGFVLLGIAQPGVVTDVAQGSATYQVAFAIPKGQVSLSGSLIFSPGGIGGHNTPAAFRAAGAADPEYAITKFNATALRMLPGDFSLFARGQAQFASEELLGSEAFSAGGIGTVRGYDASEVGGGEDGYLFSAELRTPPVAPLTKMGVKPLPKESLSGIFFLDYASVNSFTRDNFWGENTDLLSIGPGLRYALGTYFTMSLDWGFQLKDSNANPNSSHSRNQRLHMSMQASF